MSLLRNLTGITTPSSTDLFYVVQNNTDYKMTSEQFLNFAKSAIVVSLTQAQYDALTPAEKSNGSIYLINDATLSASDISYGQGTVEEALDDLAQITVKEIIVQLGSSLWYGVYYGEYNIQPFIDNYGICISALVIEEGPNSDFSIQNNRFCGTQLIKNASDNLKTYLRVYSPQASDTANHYVKVRLAFSNKSAV